MAEPEGRRSSSSTQLLENSDLYLSLELFLYDLDIEQIPLEAQNRWLRPPEICEILRNYKKFRIAPEPPNRPPSGSIFLFDRKVLRHFRKDGHNWRKKKDGRTVKEAHERLKAGSVDVLHCYYAHGEGNGNFQRRSYWMLEEDLMHIVLVHYREVKGNNINYSQTRDCEETSQSAHSGSPISSSFLINNNQVLSRTMDISNLNSVHTSKLDVAQSDGHQASSRDHSFFNLQQSEERPVINSQMDLGLLTDLDSYFSGSYPTDQSDYQGKQLNIPGLNFVSLDQENLTEKINNSGLSFHEPGKLNGAASWDEGLERSGTQFQGAPFRPSVSSTSTANMMGIHDPETLMVGQLSIEHGFNQEVVANSKSQLSVSSTSPANVMGVNNRDWENVTIGELSIEDNNGFNLEVVANSKSQLSVSSNSPANVMGVNNRDQENVTIGEVSIEDYGFNLEVVSNSKSQLSVSSTSPANVMGVNNQNQENVTIRDLSIEDYEFNLEVVSNSKSQLSVSSTSPANVMGVNNRDRENATIGEISIEDYGFNLEVVANSKSQLQWQIASEDGSSHVAAWPMGQKLNTELVNDLRTRFQEQEGHYVDVDNDPVSFSTNSDKGNEFFMPNEFLLNLSNSEVEGHLTSDLDTQKDQVNEEDLGHYSSTRHPLVDCFTAGDEVLKNFDSFSSWMSRELGEVHEAHVQPSSGIYWSTVESGNAIEDSGMSPQVHDAYLLSPPFLSQDQLFSILDVDVDNDPVSFSTNSDKGNESFMPNEFVLNHSNSEVEGHLTSDLDTQKDQVNEEDLGHYSSTRHPLVDGFTAGDEVLKKADSFSRWMSKDLGEVHEAHVQPSSGICWSTVESGNAIEDSGISPQVHDAYLLSPPSLSQDQLFSILDFSPNWAYTGMETKVLITGTFLKDKNDAMKCKWSCMFGEVEVLAEVLPDGVLHCRAPVHAAGRVPFYITCSNRVACSEVREFEYRIGHSCYMDTDTYGGSTTEMILHVRLGKLLSLDSVGYAITLSNSAGEKSHISSKISSLLKEDDNEWFQMEKLTTDEVNERLFQRILKDKLHAWLLHKVAEVYKGPCVLDKEGQGVLHLAAALGYDWAIAPTIAAGVNINFRDVNGWTALHWAASCGREQTVITLVALGGAPGALTDPTPEFPSGRAPADLASINGHKGIAGYLAESSLKAHLEALTLETFEDGNASEVPGVKAIQTIAELSAAQYIDGDLDGRSLKDSLTAVRNAVQAAARIHEVFRVKSFHRKQFIESGDDKFGMSDEQALSFISFNSNRAEQHNEITHTAAAIRIQNKFRSWKGRTEFLMIRQLIVKIQAHVRGSQVRKHYRKIVWSVGIVEKVILRWRRRGSGLRGFRPGLIEDRSMQGTSSKEDDYDFLKEGKKQTEARLDKALARVRSMDQYPEARDQYRRLLNGVSGFQETKVVSEKLLNDSEEDLNGDDIFDLEILLGD